MDLNPKALLHNKPALAGIGVAAAAGLFVLVRRKHTTGSSRAGASVAGGGTPYTVPSSYPDTTGMQLVQQWGQFAQNLQSDLSRDFPGAGNGTGAIPPQTPTGPTAATIGPERLPPRVWWLINNARDTGRTMQPLGPSGGPASTPVPIIR